MINCQMCVCVFFIVNIIGIELSIIFHNSSLFKNAEKTLFFILLIDAHGLFPRLNRSHCKDIAIKVSYVKKYSRQQEKFFLSF